MPFERHLDGNRRAFGIALLQNPRRRLFLISEVPLYIPHAYTVYGMYQISQVEVHLDGDRSSPPPHHLSKRRAVCTIGSTA